MSIDPYPLCSRELEELCYVRSNTERLIRLNALMNDHWFLDDFMETMSDTFGTELVFTIMDIYVQLLLLVYVIIWDTVVRRVFKDNAYPYISGIIESGIIIGKFIYLCYRCDSSVKEVSSMDHYRRYILYFYWSPPEGVCISSTVT